MNFKGLAFPKRLNFILIGLLFGTFYWIFESVREAIVFGKGTLAHCIFEPNAESLWMRLTVGGMLLFFGAVVQALREQS
jgi:hypothetical protein